MNLTFQFSDLQSFLLMGGHGPYVWTCYVVTWFALLYLVLQPLWQRRQFIRQQRALARRATSPTDSTAQEL